MSPGIILRAYFKTDFFGNLWDSFTSGRQRITRNLGALVQTSVLPLPLFMQKSC